MLRKIESFSELDSRKLMDVCAEGSEENAEALITSWLGLL